MVIKNSTILFIILSVGCKLGTKYILFYHLTKYILCHDVLQSYMEDHLKNKDRLDEEWEGLVAYEPDLSATTVGTESSNMRKNRYTDIVPCKFYPLPYPKTLLMGKHFTYNTKKKNMQMPRHYTFSG